MFRTIGDALDGPWQCRIMSTDRGRALQVLMHTHPAIAIDAGFWGGDEREYEPPADDDGYYQPDANCDLSDGSVATARLIAWAPSLIDALIQVCNDRSIPDNGTMRAAREILAVATTDITQQSAEVVQVP